jgi:molecular chaperone DnaK
MQREAEMHAEEDKQKREEIDARNEADSAVYRSEKMLRANSGKISDSDKGKIEDASAAVKDALKRGDAATIKSASTRLNELWQAVSAELYKTASARPQGGHTEARHGTNPRGTEGSQDEVIDAEVVEEHK